MSLADNILRRRQELEGAFRARYNPMESVVSALSDIEKAAFERQGEEAKRKYETERQAREAEKFGLEKTETEARTKQLQAQTERDREERIALANQREARRQEFLARAAAQREEAKRKAQEESARRVAQQVHGYLQQLGLTTKDIFETKPLDKELRGVVEARGGETAATKTGTARDDITKMADVAGMSPEELMMRVQELETGAEGERQKLSLIGEKAKTEQARQRELDRRRRAISGTGALKPKSRLDELREQKLALDIAYADEKLFAKRLETGSAGGTKITPPMRLVLEKRRDDATSAAQIAKTITNLFDEHPELKKMTGPLDARLAKYRTIAGDAKVAELQATIGRAFDAYRRAITGAAAGPSELENLQKNVPAMTDNLAEMMGKLNAGRAIVNVIIGTLDMQLDKGDLRAADEYLGVSPLSAADSAPNPAADKEAEDTASAFGGRVVK